MKRYDMIQLVSDAPEARGIHEEHQEIPRFVYCEIRSVGRREAYEAMSHGFHPECVFVLSQAFDYHGEKRIIWNGETYHVIRPYESEADEIELTAEKVIS